MIKHPHRAKRPGYDPERQLLAAVVLEAVRACSAQRHSLVDGAGGAGVWLGPGSV